MTRYLLYLIGAASLFLCSIAYFEGTMSVNYMYFIDYIRFAFMFLMAVLSLFCTKSGKPFGRSFLFVVGKCDLSRMESERSLLALKTVTTAAMLSAAAIGLVEIINCTVATRDLPISPELFHTLGVSIHLSLLGLLYAMFLCVILLPIQIALKKNILFKRQDESMVLEADSQQASACAGLACTVRKSAHPHPRNSAVPAKR